MSYHAQPIAEEELEGILVNTMLGFGVCWANVTPSDFKLSTKQIRLGSFPLKRQFKHYF